MYKGIVQFQMIEVLHKCHTVSFFELEQYMAQNNWWISWVWSIRLSVGNNKKNKNKKSIQADTMTCTRPVIRGWKPYHSLQLSMLYFRWCYRWTFLLIEFTHKVTIVIQVWETRLQVTLKLNYSPAHTYTHTKENNSEMS